MEPWAVLVITGLVITFLAVIIFLVNCFIMVNSESKREFDKAVKMTLNSFGIIVVVVIGGIIALVGLIMAVVQWLGGCPPH